MILISPKPSLSPLLKKNMFFMIGNSSLFPNLYYDQANQIQLQKYKDFPKGPYNFPLKFIESKQKTTLWNKIFLDRQLSNRFKYLTSFINYCQTNSNQQKIKQNFPNIQQNFALQIQSHLKSRPQTITIHQCNIKRAYYIQQRKIYGIFYHRKLNLAKSCYSTQFVQKTKDLKYRIKNKLTRLQDMKDYEKALWLYENEQYNKIYRDTYEGFQKSQFITRSLIKIIADIKVQIQIPQFEQSIRLGYNSPTQHILQIQSYKIPYQQQQWVISDVDFFTQGNSYFTKERN